MGFDVAVLGGGASGLVCAIECAKAGLNVAIAERNHGLGKKILVTGNGRCNLTNTDIGPEHYYGSDKLMISKLLDLYSAEDVIRFFNGIGLYTRERDRLIYPNSNKAASVAEALRNGLVKYNVSVVSDFEIKDVKKENGKFRISARDGKSLQAENIVVATGLEAYDGTDIGIGILKKFGHKCFEIYPALVQLKTDSAFIKGLKGVKFNGKISALSKGKVIGEEVGEILFTEYGLSGIAVMQLSRLYSEYDDLSILMDFLPHLTEEEVAKILTDIQDFYKDAEIAAEEFLGGLVDKKLGHRILKFSGIDNLSENIRAIEGKQILKIASAFKSTQVKITGHNGFKNAQVCGGGADLAGFDIETLESVYEKGLYAAGEVLDVIGDCGGYNLHWAWITGIHAAKAITRGHSQGRKYDKSK